MLTARCEVRTVRAQAEAGRRGDVHIFRLLARERAMVMRPTIRFAVRLLLSAATAAVIAIGLRGQHVIAASNLALQMPSDGAVTQHFLGTTRPDAHGDYFDQNGQLAKARGWFHSGVDISNGATDPRLTSSRNSLISPRAQGVRAELNQMPPALARSTALGPSRRAEHVRQGGGQG